MSKIEWTGRTWNPLAGCSIVSTECKNCYAMRMAGRLEAMGQAKYAGLTQIVNGNTVWNGTVRLDREALNIPHDRKKPTTYFVNSMSDMFHESLSHEEICAVWSVMVVVDRHTYQCLTKRAERMKEFVNGWIRHMRDVTLRPVENIHLGVSVGYKLAKPRIDHLRDTIAAIRFLSCEPLLEDLGELNLEGIHWVIVGGESGPGARPFDLQWGHNIVEQCRKANVPVFVKQVGAKPTYNGLPVIGCGRKGGDPATWPEFLRFREFPVAAQVVTL
jgi:protein gp37